MALFALADLHLSLSADKAMDVFPGWENYVERIERNWRATVGEEDTVVIPGDVSWEMKITDAAADFGFLDVLPGRKLIFKGNHDLWWTSMTKMNAFLTEHGFTTIRFLNNDAVLVEGQVVCGTRGWLIEESGTDSKLIKREALRLEMSLQAGQALGEDPIVFLHYPPITRDHRCEELIEVLLRYGVRRVYYGHIHGSSAVNAFQGTADGVRYTLVSADRVDFTPVLVGDEKKLQKSQK